MPADSPLGGQKTAPSAGSLSKTSNSHIVARGWPPYLLSPILYEVDRYGLIVDAFQGQSYEKQQSQGTASGSTSKGYMRLLREASFPTLLGDQDPTWPCPRLSSFPGHQPFPHLRSLTLCLSYPLNSPALLSTPPWGPRTPGWCCPGVHPSSLGAPGGQRGSVLITSAPCRAVNSGERVSLLETCHYCLMKASEDQGKVLR